MSAKQTLPLSKRLVFCVLGLAFILVMVSSLLTFSASRKLQRTLTDLAGNQYLNDQLETLPMRVEALLHMARRYVRTQEHADFAKLHHALDDWKLWREGRDAWHLDMQAGIALHQIESLAEEVIGELKRLTELGAAGQVDQVQSIWMHIEDEMPGQRLHAMTARLSYIIRSDFEGRTRDGAAVAVTHQRTSLAIVILATLLGVIGALLMIRRMRELESFITICAWTKRVKYEGRWVPFEEFLEKRFQLKLSHGISEEAALLEMERTSEQGTNPE